MSIKKMTKYEADKMVEFLKTKGLKTVVNVNGKTYINKREAIEATIKGLEDLGAEDNINGTVCNEKNLQKYFEANEICKKLCENIIAINAEYRNHKSYAQTLITCDSFCFGTRTDGRDKKELMERFVELVDDFEVSHGTNTQVFVGFSVNDVWSE
uniref:Uncharacterized protein n=1 Tax=uncultured bacterium contig00081 TaxID=1181557 RepID=A0A806K0J4_9BACT|nr:hypothetical protein [uncultured bacterium contig00081]